MLFFHLDLPPGASSFHHLFIYLDLPLSASSKETSNPAQLGCLKTPILFEYYLLSPRRSFRSFYRVHRPSHSASLFQTKQHISDAMYGHEWHVWVFKLVFFIWILFYSSVLGFFCFSFAQVSFTGLLVWLIMLLFFLWRTSSLLTSSCHIITLSMFELWFFSLIAGGIPALPPFLNWFPALSINITWVMKKFQNNAFILVM